MKEYTNIKADDFCCVGAVLETILIKNNYTNYSQYAIINEFGLTIPKTAKVTEKINNITYYQIDDGAREKPEMARTVDKTVERMACVATSKRTDLPLGGELADFVGRS